MLSLNSLPLHSHEIPFQAITSGHFGGKTLPIDNWGGSYPFQVFHSFANNLSYVYSNEADQKNITFRIGRYIEEFNSRQSTSCLGRILFVAHKLLFTQERTINLEEADTERTVTLIQYLFNGIAPGAYALSSINSKINQGQSLFTQMILGLRPLEVDSKPQMTLEKILNHQLNEHCQVVVCVWDHAIQRRHAALFISSQENNQHYLVDTNLPIVKFVHRQGLLEWAPKIIRSMYSKTGEVSAEQLKKGGIQHEFSSSGKVEILRTYSFQKISSSTPGFHRFRELSEYSKAVWQLPFEKGTQNLEGNLWKIKIQRLIYLVIYPIKQQDYFFPPFNLSPLTDYGVKRQIVEDLLTNPVPIPLNGMEGSEIIYKLVDKISNVKTEGNVQKLDFFNAVMQVLKDQFENLQVASEKDHQVTQFRFNCYSSISNPLW